MQCSAVRSYRTEELLLYRQVTCESAGNFCYQTAEKGNAMRRASTKCSKKKKRGEKSSSSSSSSSGCWRLCAAIHRHCSYDFSERFSVGGWVPPSPCGEEEGEIVSQCKEEKEALSGSVWVRAVLGPLVWDILLFRPDERLKSSYNPLKSQWQWVE